eukprot:TRINITY_DN5480_c0_g1_i1.p1 TRINITY_DN5480_c0_g1~~TRINITY_DN5480_c0_g1_i1.p1  ORF type:complete len:208 (+),score=34.71 TRINITY_DN5480_c0_g1_i1:45-626(+)
MIAECILIFIIWKILRCTLTRPITAPSTDRSFLIASVIIFIVLSTYVFFTLRSDNSSGDDYDWSNAQPIPMPSPDFINVNDSSSSSFLTNSSSLSSSSSDSSTDNSGLIYTFCALNQTDCELDLGNLLTIVVVEERKGPSSIESASHSWAKKIYPLFCPLFLRKDQTSSSTFYPYSSSFLLFCNLLCKLDGIL